MVIIVVMSSCLEAGQLADIDEGVVEEEEYSEWKLREYARMKKEREEREDFLTRLDPTRRKEFLARHDKVCIVLIMMITCSILSCTR